MRDVGYGPPRLGSSTRNGGSGPFSRQDTLQSLTSESAKSAAPATSSQSQSTSSKRAPSPEHRRTREESRDYPSKRARPSSPPPRRLRDSERWAEGGSGRRHNSPMWERERERSSGKFKEEREEDKSVQLPSVLSWFIGTLPAPNTFDGACLRCAKERFLADSFRTQAPFSAPTT